MWASKIQTQQKENVLWIAKPHASSCGRGLVNEYTMFTYIYNMLQFDLIKYFIIHHNPKN